MPQGKASFFFFLFLFFFFSTSSAIFERDVASELEHSCGHLRLGSDGSLTPTLPPRQQKNWTTFAMGPTNSHLSTYVAWFFVAFGQSLSNPPPLPIRERSSFCFSFQLVFLFLFVGTLNLWIASHVQFLLCFSFLPCLYLAKRKRWRHLLRVVVEKTDTDKRWSIQDYSLTWHDYLVGTAE